MKEFPSYPVVADAPPELFERGHIWLHERIDGAPLRFQTRPDGRLRFGDDVRTFGDDVPPAYDHAVRHLEENFDRAALRAAVDDVESVVFFGVATHRRGVDYEWDRLPNFVGVDIWAEDDHLQPDRVEKVYDRLGLDPLNAIRAEQRAADFNPERYTFPPSNWYDGPVAGVLVRNKTGLRARLDNPAVVTASKRVDDVDDVETFARRQATAERFDAVARQLEREGRPVTFDALYERTTERIVRATHHRLFAGQSTDMRTFRSAVAEQVQQYLAEKQ